MAANGHAQKGQRHPEGHWGKWKGIRTGWMKNPDAPIALYNLDTDLAELHDVAAQHPDVVAFLKTLLAKRKTAALSNWNPSY